MIRMIYTLVVSCIFFITSDLTAQYPASFLNVHCEPGDAYLFPKLVEMVQLADSFGIPLNIQFTPQWGSEIISDVVKLNKIRKWQKHGHEIGAHHHGIEAGSGWDGYTNHPPQDWTHPAKYIGTMDDFMSILIQVAGDSLLLNGGFMDTFDWPKRMLYRTTGQALEDAISQPVYENNNGQDCYTISYCVAFTESKVDSLIKLYDTAKPDEVFGFNNHVFNYDFSTSYLRKWMSFIAGKNNKTVRRIMRERGLLTFLNYTSKKKDVPKDFLLFQNYPNPFNPTTKIKFSIPNVVETPYMASLHTTLIVYDVLGREVATLIYKEVSPGNYEIEFPSNVGNASLEKSTQLPSGMYFYQLRAGFYVSTKKMLLVK